MKFSANKSELLPTARRMSLVVGKRFLSKEQSCVHMEADAAQSTVVFTATNDNCTLQIRHKCSVEQSGKALLFAGVWLEMLRLFDDEATFITATEKYVSVRNSKSVYEFPLMDASKYPQLPQLAPNQLIDCANLPEITSKVLFSVARGGSPQPQLKCVHITVHNGQFRAESCDSYRMTAAYNTAIQNEPMDLLLSDSTMKTLLEIMRGIPTCKIGVSGKQVIFLAPNLIFTTQSSNYQFLSLEKIIQNFKPAAAVDVAGSLLFTTLSRLGAGNTLGACVVLRTDQNDRLSLLYISSKQVDLHAQIEMTASVQHVLPTPEGFCYTFNHLLDAARLIKDKAVTLQFDNSGCLMLQTDTEMHILTSRQMPKEAKQPNAKRKSRKKAA